MRVRAACVFVFVCLFVYLSDCMDCMGRCVCIWVDSCVAAISIFSNYSLLKSNEEKVSLEQRRALDMRKVEKFSSIP